MAQVVGNKNRAYRQRMGGDHHIELPDGLAGIEKFVADAGVPVGQILGDEGARLFVRFTICCAINGRLSSGFSWIPNRVSAMP